MSQWDFHGLLGQEGIDRTYDSEELDADIKRRNLVEGCFEFIDSKKCYNKKYYNFIRHFLKCASWRKG